MRPAGCVIGTLCPQILPNRRTEVNVTMPINGLGTASIRSRATDNKRPHVLPQSASIHLARADGARHACVVATHCSAITKYSFAGLRREMQMLLCLRVREPAFRKMSLVPEYLPPHPSPGPR